MVGAHIGSFEALRALGRHRGVRVAMIMYEDNARLINATLAALAPKAVLHTIALGRLDAMLSLRRWLDDGGIAGLLGDRTLPVSSQRSKNHVIDFLGAPARFSDGPFRLAAMLRRPVVFMAGLYHGGNRYELRFMPLADFSQAQAGTRDALDHARRWSATSRRSRRCAARRRTTGSTSSTSGASDDADNAAASGLREPVVGLAAVLAATLLAAASALAAAPFDLGQLMKTLAQVRSGEATFVERREIAMLDRTLQSSGRLSFEAPDTFVRETLRPNRDKVAVDRQHHDPEPRRRRRGRWRSTPRPRPASSSRRSAAR